MLIHVLTINKLTRNYHIGSLFYQNKGLLERSLTLKHRRVKIKNVQVSMDAYCIVRHHKLRYPESILSKPKPNISRKKLKRKQFFLKEKILNI